MCDIDPLQGGPTQHAFDVFDRYVSAYVFHSVGQNLPLHTHDFSHTTSVLQGAVVVSDGGQKQKTLKVGASIIFRPGVPHRIEAIENETIIVNIADISQSEFLRRKG